VTAPAVAGCEHELSGSRPPPRPTLKRRAESTKALPRPRWRVRMLRASPAPAGLRALSAGVHVRAGVARPDAGACGGTSRAAQPDAEPAGWAHDGRCRARTLGDAHAERSTSCQCMTAPAVAQLFASVLRKWYTVSHEFAVASKSGRPPLFLLLSIIIGRLSGCASTTLRIQ